MFPFLPGKKGLTFVCYIIIPVNMKHQSEKPLAPYSFSRCFNAQCAKAETCLHRLAAVRDTPEYPSIRVINPLCIPADSSKCPYFQSAQKAHVAWGISHLLDDVPYKYLHTLKNRLIAHFGRGKYYRFYREESYLSPADQAYIRSIFRQYNIQGEPAFDSYSEEYSW